MIPGGRSTVVLSVLASVVVATSSSAVGPEDEPIQAFLVNDATAAPEDAVSNVTRTLQRAAQVMDFCTGWRRLDALAVEPAPDDPGEVLEFGRVHVSTLALINPEEPVVDLQSERRRRIRPPEVVAEDLKTVLREMTALQTRAGSAVQAEKNGFGQSDLQLLLDTAQLELLAGPFTKADRRLYSFFYETCV